MSLKWSRSMIPTATGRPSGDTRATAARARVRNRLRFGSSVRVSWWAMNALIDSSRRSPRLAETVMAKSSA